MKLMRRIYTAAKLVLVWLGARSRWHEGISGLEKMAQHVPDDQLPPFLGFVYDEEKSIPSMKLAESLELLREGCKPLEFKGNLAFELTQRLWFKRTWVLQEFLLAEQVVFVYGGQQISKEAVRKAFIWAYASKRGGYMSGKDPLTLPRIVTEWWSSHAVAFPRLLDARESVLQGTRLTLEQWMRLSSGRRATDPRDLVYVGLNLLKKDCVRIKRDVLQLESVGASNALRPPLPPRRHKSALQLKSVGASSVLRPPLPPRPNKSALQLEGVGASNSLKSALPPRPNESTLSISNSDMQPTMKSTTLLPRGLWSKLEVDYEATDAEVSVNLAACLLSQEVGGVSQLLSLAARPIGDNYEGTLLALLDLEQSHCNLSNTPSWAPGLGSWNVCTWSRKSRDRLGSNMMTCN